MVYQLGYVSTTTSGVERRRLLDILTVARSRNAAADITGVLLYRDGRFLQLLEGSAQEVGSLFRTIASDHRHTDVRCIWTAHAASRLFREWSMGFRDLTDDPLDHPGYVNLLSPADGDPTSTSSSALHALWGLLQPTPSWLDEQPEAHPQPTISRRAVLRSATSSLRCVAAWTRLAEPTTSGRPPSQMANRPDRG